MAQTSKCGPQLVLCLLIAMITGSATPTRAHAASVPAIFSSERFAALLHDDPSVWETARRLVQNPDADFSQGFEKNGCGKLLTSENTGFQDLYSTLARLVNREGSASAFVAEWARRLEEVSAAGSTAKARRSLVIDVGASSDLIIFNEPRFIYRVSKNGLWKGWGDAQDQQTLRENEKEPPKQLGYSTSKDTVAKPAVPTPPHSWNPAFGEQRQLFSNNLDRILFLVSLGQVQLIPGRSILCPSRGW